MKKFYVLFLVLVLVIGFSVTCKYKDPQSGVEDKMNNQLWRGVMTGKVETYGPWALIQVKNPDDYNHPFEMMVVFNSTGGATYFLDHVPAKTEILFSKVSVSATEPTSSVQNLHSPLGLFYGFAKDADTKDVVIKGSSTKGFTIMNPPQK